MTLRESDDRIVPMTLEDQSSRWKSSNIDAGKAVRISRSCYRALSVHSDGLAVHCRGSCSRVFASWNKSFLPNQYSLRTPAYRMLFVDGELPLATVVPSEIWEPDARKWHVRI